MIFFSGIIDAIDPLCPFDVNRDFKIQDATASRTRWLINGLGLERRRLRGKSKVKVIPQK